MPASRLFYMQERKSNAGSTAAPGSQALKQREQDQAGGEPAKADQQGVEATGQGMRRAIADAVLGKTRHEIDERGHQRQRNAGAQLGEESGDTPGLARRLGTGLATARTGLAVLALAVLALALPALAFPALRVAPLRRPALRPPLAAPPLSEKPEAAQRSRRESAQPNVNRTDNARLPITRK
jgi:hypothetical protein